MIGTQFQAGRFYVVGPQMAILEENKPTSLEDGKQMLNPWNKRDPISKTLWNGIY